MTFDEQNLRHEIAQMWGEDSVHLAVFDVLLQAVRPELLDEKVRLCTAFGHGRTPACGEMYYDDDEASGWFPFCAVCLAGGDPTRVRWWKSNLTEAVSQAYTVSIYQGHTGSRLLEELREHGVTAHLTATYGNGPIELDMVEQILVWRSAADTDE